MSDGPTQPTVPQHFAPLRKLMVWANPLVWLTRFTSILINGVLSQFDANILQRRFVEVVLFCLQNGLPIRIICLKPRQRGISTVTVGVMCWLLTRWPGRAVIIGRKGKQTNNLWRMLQRFHSEDRFPWGVGKPRVTDEQATYANGSTVTKESAEGLDPGRSDTYQCILCTEVALWGGDNKVKNASGVLAGLMACIKPLPKTYVVWESTSAGPSGAFYRKWKDESVTFDEFKRDPRRHHGKFVQVFAGWWEFPDCCDPVDDKEAAEIKDGVGALNAEEMAREKELVRLYGLNAGQLKWFRRILSECDNDPGKRDLDYPATPEDAFRAGQLCHFNWGGLKKLNAEAAGGYHSLQWGRFQRQTERQEYPDWSTAGCGELGAGDVCMAEAPRPGHRYSVVVDTMKGYHSGEDKKDLDCHAVGVVREGYFDGSGGGWQRAKMVACLVGPRRRKGGLVIPEARWEPFVLASKIKDLSDYYGKALVTVENNNDPGVIPRLKQLGVPLYEDKYDEKDVENSGKGKGKLGFTMSDNDRSNGVRSTILAGLQHEIRETARGVGGLEIPFPWVIAEMEHFVNDPDTGRVEAATGWHDDWVMMLAIARAVKNSATTFYPPASVVHGMPGFRGQLLAGEQLEEQGHRPLAQAGF
jgi:hypothetical protein